MWNKSMPVNCDNRNRLEIFVHLPTSHNQSFGSLKTDGIIEEIKDAEGNFRLDARDASRRASWNRITGAAAYDRVGCGEDGLRIKQMAAIIVIIRIMISEREVGSLGLTGNH